MRVGILTFHNAINYGAVIQCYALMDFFEKRGHDVEIVDYRLKAIEEYRQPFSYRSLSKINGLKTKLFYLINNMLLGRRKKRVIKSFDDFLKTKLHLSNKYSFGQNVSLPYDFVIFGSDQIWNLKITKGFDPVFWGQIQKGNAIYATYAASMGELVFIPDKQWSIAADYLKNFDYISVRENALQSFLNTKFGMDVDCCIDPTLLSDSKALDAIAIKPQEDNYIYMYNVTKDKYAEAFAMHISSLIGCKVIMTDPKPRIRFHSSCRVAEAISPEEFLGYIKYARLVIGNSFHLIALSLVFKKDFYSLDSYRPERIKSVLNSIGLLERHVRSTDQINRILPVDYTQVEGKLNCIKESSLSYINKIGL